MILQTQLSLFVSPQYPWESFVHWQRVYNFVCPLRLALYALST